MSRTMDTHTLPHGIARDVRFQCTPRRVNVISPSSGELNEKELMHGLNDRLAGFIEKVHQLERQNQLLETEIGEIRGKAAPASSLEEEYGPELKKLRQLVQDITHQKHQIEVEHRDLEDELCDLRTRHEREARSRSCAESDIVVLKKDISEAYQAKLQLDKRAQALVDEIRFLKETHEAEVSEMMDQIQDAQVSVRAHEFGSPGVTAALRDIRAQLEGHTASDVQQVAETFRSQFARLTEAAEAKREALRATQREIQEHRRRLQAKNIELDCAKGTREALEKQLHDVEDRHKEEMIHYQNTIKELENELINCKFDMSGYLREYQDLLNVKMALDVEIMSYRKLLCGEEARLSTMSDTHISLPYIYHQSPVYTLPCLSRPGGPHRRAEPQYKFVEEIITETTREIEMSEFEEMGSEETEAEAGKDEQEDAKRDGGSGEEEGEVDNKDGGEGEGEQVCDSEQDQVASVGDSASKGDDGSPGEVDDGEKDQSGEEESKETEAVDMEGDSCIDDNTQSKVLSESLGEEREKVAENTKEEKEAAVVTAQKDLPLKADGLKPEVPAEDQLQRKSDDAKKEDAEKESCVPAQAKKPVDEAPARVSEEPDKTQELSSVVKAQDEIRVLASETAEKSADRAAETKTLPSAETKTVPSAETKSTPSAETPVSSSAATKSEEKENGRTESKESKSEPAKVEDKVAKSTQDAKRDSNTVQDKESPLKPSVKSLPEEEDKKPSSGDATQTAQAASPKEKTIVSAEIKELQQAAPESIQVQKSKPSDVSEKTDPQGKTEKVESSKSEK